MVCGKRHDFEDRTTTALRILFQEIYDAEYKEKFEEVGIEYFYTLIDDAVCARDSQ